MRILLVAATAAEIRPTLDHLAGEKGEVETLLTGIGMVATTYQLTRHLAASTDYGLVLQAGICGAYDPGLALGEVVYVQRDRFLGQGAEDRDGRWLSLPEIGFPAEPPFGAEGWLDADLPPEMLVPYRAVSGGTADRSSGSTATIAQVLRHYPRVQVESMEGAALHYVCRQFRLPFLQLRAISNYVEPRDRTKWQIVPAIHSLNEALRGLIAAAR